MAGQCTTADIMGTRPGRIERQIVFLHELRSRLTCSGFRPDMNAWVVSTQQVLDEGSFASAVLSQQ